MDIDNEVLIALVFEKPALWDKKHKFHCNRNVTDKIWKEISLEMKEDESRLRKKWRYLRDQFSVEFGKIPPSRSGDEGTSVYPRWPYFKSLLFLKDVIKPRLTTGSLTSKKSQPSPATNQGAESSEDQGEDQGENQDEDQGEDQGTPRHQRDYHESGEPSTSAMSTSQPTPREIRPKKSMNEQILDIEAKKLKLLQEKQKSRFRNTQSNEDNEHLLFLKSLLPHIEKIPQHKVLSFRNRIQRVVEEFAYTSSPLHYNGPSNSSMSNYSYLSTDDFRNSLSPPNSATSLYPVLPIDRSTANLSTQSQVGQHLEELYNSETNPQPPVNPPPSNLSTQSQVGQHLEELYNSETNPQPPVNPPPSNLSTQSQVGQHLEELYNSETNPQPPVNPPPSNLSTQSQVGLNLAELYSTSANTLNFTL